MFYHVCFLNIKNNQNISINFIHLYYYCVYVDCSVYPVYFFIIQGNNSKHSSSPCSAFFFILFQIRNAGFSARSLMFQSRPDCHLSLANADRQNNNITKFCQNLLLLYSSVSIYLQFVMSSCFNLTPKCLLFLKTMP